MIKVGDKFIFEEDEWTVIDVTGCDDTLIARTKDGEDNVFFQSTVYKSWYEQQKLRVDELEKQNDILKHNIRVELDSSRNMYIRMCEEKHRADRAEKRWSELKNTVKEFHQEAIIEVSKCKDEGDKGIVYACKKILGKISDLEEDSDDENL